MNAAAEPGRAALESLAKRLRAWGENDADPAYFQGDALSCVLLDCGAAGEAILKLIAENERLRDEWNEAQVEVDIVRDDSAQQMRMLNAIANKLGLAHDEGLEDAAPFLAAIDQVRSGLLHVEQGAEAMEPHDYEVIGTTYDGVKVLRAVSELTHFSRDEIRAAIKAALSSEPRCTATGNPCGTDAVTTGRQCPDNRWGGRCAHRIAEDAKAAPLPASDTGERDGR